MKNTTIYEATDGLRFENKKSCEIYEKELESNKEKINKELEKIIDEDIRNKEWYYGYFSCIHTEEIRTIKDGEDFLEVILRLDFDYYNGSFYLTVEPIKLSNKENLILSHINSVLNSDCHHYSGYCDPNCRKIIDCHNSIVNLINENQEYIDYIDDKIYKILKVKDYKNKEEK